MRGQERLEVWVDAAVIGEPRRVGTLMHDRGQVRFTYDQAWLGHPARFALDPDLSLDDAPFFPRPESGNFGIFLDSSPDRWGQTLMKRREALEAKDGKRAVRTLRAWDFLLGVQDVTRQGALRFRPEGGDEFVAAHALAAPPVTSLPELEAVARELTAKKLDNLPALRRWLAVLVAPGASLGGARPKANFTQSDGSLWIAKFPSREDDLDVGAWEGVAHTLAGQAGVSVPPARLARLGRDHRTFCVRRFDRQDGRRIFYASAMTLLQKSQSEGTSYIEMAQFLQRSGARKYVKTDLEQLFRRVAFNVAIANRDDHLRNHGFVPTSEGWRLSPAFDMNPNPDRADHVLNIDDTDNRPGLRSLLGTVHHYALDGTRADAIIDDVRAAARGWRTVARKAGIGRAEIEGMAGAFEALES